MRKNESGTEVVEVQIPDEILEVARDELRASDGDVSLDHFILDRIEFELDY